MMSSLQLRNLSLGLLAWLAVDGASALTLGRAQGVALIGRPLEVTVSLDVDDQMGDAPLCAQADVFYGDTKVESGRVRTIVPQPGASGPLRVAVGVPVNEPVVTIYLNVGCSSRITRRYVLLSEQPPESASEPRAPAITQPQRAAAQGLPAAPAAVPAMRPQAALPRLPKPAPVARGNAPAVKSQPQLRLEPLDLSIDRDPSLRLTPDLPVPGEFSSQQRTVAAALWRLLNAQPEQLLRENQRLQSLEGELKAVRQSLAENQRGIAALREEVREARAGRYANPLVYALVVVALLALVAAAYGWRRNGWRPAMRREWWRPARSAPDSDLGPASVLPQAAARRPTRPSPLPPTAPGAMDLDLSFSESGLGRLQGAAEPATRMPAFQASIRDDFQGSQPASLRSVRAEEVHDIQQEADFFVSLGEYDRAIDVLRHHIGANPQTSAVAWLDLLEIYHTLKRPEEYEWVRGEFQRAFNADLPSFQDYHHEGLGLEGFPQALSRIEALWPSRKVLEVIEESVFRRPGQPGEAFSLEAYRELLLLHHIAREILDQRTPGFVPSDPGHSDFSNTNIHPLSASQAVAAANDMAFPSIGLDIDLDEPASPSSELMAIGEATAALPDSNLLDFDLPDIDASQFKAKKTRE